MASRTGGVWSTTETRGIYSTGTGANMINFSLPAGSDGVRITFSRSAGANAYDGVGTPYTIDQVRITKLDAVGTKTITVSEEEHVGGSGYRYGFNGKEMDSEISGTGNQYDYGFRIYNPRIGRFLSVDPLTKSYPMLTPYQFASNRPIDGIDLDGLEWKKVETYDPKTGITNVHFHVVLTVVNESKVYKDIATLKKETMGQFAAAFEGRTSSDGKTTYSASIEINEAHTGDDGPFSVIIADMPKGVPGMSGPVSTQVNSFSVAGGKYDKSTPDKVQSRSAEDMAQDIVHELMHTANVLHPDDDDNAAADVDLLPDMSNLNKNGRPLSYKLAPGANLKEVIQNIMLYNFKVIEGKKVTEYEPDKSKRGKVSPDQAKIASEQVDKDAKSQN